MKTAFLNIAVSLAVTFLFLRSLKAAKSSGESDGTLVTTPVPENQMALQLCRKSCSCGGAQIPTFVLFDGEHRKSVDGLVDSQRGIQSDSQDVLREEVEWMSHARCCHQGSPQSTDLPLEVSHFWHFSKFIREFLVGHVTSCAGGADPNFPLGSLEGQVIHVRSDPAVGLAIHGFRAKGGSHHVKRLVSYVAASAKNVCIKRQPLNWRIHKDTFLCTGVISSMKSSKHHGA